MQTRLLFRRVVEWIPRQSFEKHDIGKSRYRGHAWEKEFLYFEKVESAQIRIISKEFQVIYINLSNSTWGIFKKQFVINRCSFWHKKSYYFVFIFKFSVLNHSEFKKIMRVNTSNSQRLSGANQVDGLPPAWHNESGKSGPEKASSNRDLLKSEIKIFDSKLSFWDDRIL